VTLREVSYAPYGNNTKLQQRLENLENLLNDQSQRLESVLQQQNASRETLESTYRTLNNVSQHNEDVRERANELLGEDELTIDPDEATDAELRERVTALEQALQEQRDSIPDDGTDTSTSEDTVSAVARFAGELTKEQVSVIAHYSNGTSKPVSDEYLRVDQSAGTIAGVGSTAVHVEDYPAGDAASVQFEWLTARENGVGRATARVDNPLVNSEAPAIDSVRVSTLATRSRRYGLGRTQPQRGVGVPPTDRCDRLRPERPDNPDDQYYRRPGDIVPDERAGNTHAQTPV